MEAGAASQEAGDKELPVDSRGGSDRPGYRRPERRRRTKLPIRPPAGLDLDPGIVIVFDLCAQCQVEPVGEERDLVLNKSGEPLSRYVRRQELQSRAVHDAIVDQAVAQSPDHVMAGAQA